MLGLNMENSQQEYEDAEIIETKKANTKNISPKEMGEIIDKIEKSKQHTAIKQIEATDKDNERQYNYALQRDEIELSKWNKSFYVGAGVTIVLSLVSIVLIFKDEKDLGIGLLATTIAGVFGFIAGAGSCKK